VLPALIVKRKQEFFFDKKEPKNFFLLGRAVDPTRAPMCKSFCFFFQKEALSIPSPRRRHGSDMLSKSIDNAVIG
jgi:hypothetical protein